MIFLGLTISLAEKSFDIGFPSQSALCQSHDSRIVRYFDRFLCQMAQKTQNHQMYAGIIYCQLINCTMYYRYSDWCLSVSIILIWFRKLIKFSVY